MNGRVKQLGRLSVLAALGAIVGIWFRSRAPEVTDEPAPGSAQWPPLLPLADRGADAAASTPSAPVLSEPSDGAPAEPAVAVDASPTAPPAQSRWVLADADGDCPPSHPVKAKERSGIYHVPGGFAYDRTNADRCYVTPADAEADGFRPAKR